MNYAALDIIHFWGDSRGKLIQKVIPTNGKVCVLCTKDLSDEAAKVCNFINLIVKHPWAFYMKNENQQFVITFLSETVTLENLFHKEHLPNEIKKTRVKRENAGNDSNLKSTCNL